MKKAFKVIGIIVVVFVVLVGIMAFTMTKDLSKMAKTTINPIEITQLKDGTYEGYYQFSRWEAQVQVTVKDGVITQVKSLKEVFPNVSDELNEKIVKEQKNDVDAVSGATVTSKAYLKAVENALQNK